MTLPFKVYPFSLTPGGSQVFPVAGSYFRVKTATGDLAITRNDTNSFGPISAGQGFKRQPFTRLLLEDRSGANNNGTIIIADEDFVDDRITGEVSVIDGGKSTTLANLAFLGSSYAACAAGQYVACALWNASTTKNVRLKQLRYDSTVTGGAMLHRKIVATFGALEPAPASKLLSGVASTAGQTYNLSNGLAIPASTSSFGVDSTFASRIFTFQEPFILTPGTGYMLATNTASAGAPQLSAQFEFVEEAIP